jgi:uncharacterized protein (DUF433 family)
VPGHRLYAWHHYGIVAPNLKVIDFEGKEATGYTFEGVVYLRLIRMLRDRVPLEKAVRAAQHLRERFGVLGPAWGDARILLAAGEVIALSKHDDWEATVATRFGQKVAPEVLFGEDFEQLRDRADALLVPQRFQPFVEIDPQARSGHPIVRETTIPTSLLYKLRLRGYSYARLRDEYPDLRLDHIKGAIAYERFLDAEAA